ncbi:unnamed protein product [Tetraodon nigroviridis]|uniref:(spotted green pufferfish) hypothetical protein n=1 Tax=Tetraodon nigroviridis TaxID=99883 RepID=Q4SUQ4_TETNG|nr:unnamed protein product [Tetraodon nigroviridis]
MAASLEGRTGGENDPAPSQNPPAISAAGPGSREGSGLRRRVQSEPAAGLRQIRGSSLTPKRKNPKKVVSRAPRPPTAAPVNASLRRGGQLDHQTETEGSGPPRAEAVLEPPEKAPARSPEVPEFNLKESDTVKRRHKPKDKEPDGGCHDQEVTTTPGTHGWVFSPSQEEVRSSKTATSLESPAAPAAGPPSNQQFHPNLRPLPQNQFATACWQRRSPCLTSARSQVHLQGRGLGTEVVQQRLDQTSWSLAAALKAVESKLSQEEDSSSGWTLGSLRDHQRGSRPLAFTAPSSPVHGPPAPGPGWVSAPQSPCLTSARSQVHLQGRGLGTEVVQQRLDQTSWSLAAALKAVESKLSQEEDSSRNAVTSARTILDDIGNMFDDLADQLDAMLD